MCVCVCVCISMYVSLSYIQSMQQFVGYDARLFGSPRSPRTRSRHLREREEQEQEAEKGEWREEK